MTTTGVLAGWYTDPLEPAATLRYWNGAEWTEHVAPRVPAAPAPTGYDPSAPPPTPYAQPPYGQPAYAAAAPAWAAHGSVPYGSVPYGAAPYGTAPYGPPNGQGEHPSDALHWIVPTGRSWQTIAAGYVGLVSLLLFPLGPVAIVLGVLGLRAASRQGSHGRGRAIFGIVTGIIATIIGIAVLIDVLNGPSQPR
jgi:hypothetical protein